jgi:hypothetical protein
MILCFFADGECSGAEARHEKGAGRKCPMGALGNATFSPPPSPPGGLGARGASTSRFRPAGGTGQTVRDLPASEAFRRGRSDERGPPWGQGPSDGLTAGQGAPYILSLERRFELQLAGAIEMQLKRRVKDPSGFGCGGFFRWNPPKRGGRKAGEGGGGTSPAGKNREGRRFDPQLAGARPPYGRLPRKRLKRGGPAAPWPPRALSFVGPGGGRGDFGGAGARRAAAEEPGGSSGRRLRGAGPLTGL